MRIHSAGLILAVLVASPFCGHAQDAQRKATRSEAESAVVSKVQPEYPMVAKQLKIQGVVELEAMISATGEVEKVTILSGNPVLTKPAVEALKKWKFKPFTTDGKAVVTQVPVSMAFKL